MSIGSYAGRVWKAVEAEGLGGRVFGALDVAGRMGVFVFADRKRIRGCLGDFKKAKRIESVEPGRYRILKGPVVPKHEVMWRYLRMEPVVSVEDLMMIAGVGDEYAREWLTLLETREIVRRLEDGRYRLVLVDPPLDPPVNEAKAERLRDLRKRKKEIAAGLRRARAAIDAVERLVEGLVEGE